MNTIHAPSLARLTDMPLVGLSGVIAFLTLSLTVTSFGRQAVKMTRSHHIMRRSGYAAMGLKATDTPQQRCPHATGVWVHLLLAFAFCLCVSATDAARLTTQESAQVPQNTLLPIQEHCLAAKPGASIAHHETPSASFCGRMAEVQPMTNHGSMVIASGRIQGKRGP